jgi:hypothetical protein
VKEADEIGRNVKQMVLEAEGESKSKPVLSFVVKDRTVPRVVWVNRCETKAEPGSESWVNRIPPGTKFLERHVENGCFLGLDGFFFHEAPSVFNAWGRLLPPLAL